MAECAHAGRVNSVGAMVGNAVECRLPYSKEKIRKAEDFITHAMFAIFSDKN